MLVYKNHNVFTQLRISATFDCWHITIKLLIEIRVCKIPRCHVNRLIIVLSSITEEVVKLFPKLLSPLNVIWNKEWGRSNRGNTRLAWRWRILIREEAIQKKFTKLLQNTGLKRLQLLITSNYNSNFSPVSKLIGSFHGYSWMFKKDWQLNILSFVRSCYYFVRLKSLE